MIDFYTWTTPNGRKVAIMLEETGLEYTVHTIHIGQGEQHDPEFLKLSPNNKIPAISDKETGTQMMESGAILMYLAEKTGQFMPTSEKARWATIEWLMFQMGGVGPSMGQVHHFTKFNLGVSEYAQDRYLNEAKRLYGVMDKRLANNEWLNGHSYSIADIAVWPWTARHDWQTINLNDYPNVARWYVAMCERSAVQRGWNIPPTDQKIPMPS